LSTPALRSSLSAPTLRDALPIYGLGGDRRAGRLRAADRRAGRVPGLDRRLAAGGGRPGAGRRHHRAPAERGPRALDPARRGAGGHLLRAVPRPLAAADPPPRPDGAGARRAARRTGADPALPAAGLAADPAGRHARAALAVGGREALAGRRRGADLSGAGAGPGG